MKLKRQMKTAKRLRETNIAEYLLYMWQTEDLLRAHRCDIDRLRQSVLPVYPEADRADQERWLSDLCNMMRAEGVTEQGHLQINRNVLLQLGELHAALLASGRHPGYHAAFHGALPFIAELRQKGGGGGETPDIEVCFLALYGLWMLRLRKQEISPETLRAFEAISALIRQLAQYYIKDKNDELSL